MNNIDKKLNLVTQAYAFETSKFPLAVKPQFHKGSPSWHQHEGFYEIVLVISGEAEHICGSRQYTLCPQEVLVIEPGTYHNYKNCNFDYYNILVDFNELKLPLFDLPHTRGFQNLFVLSPQSHQHTSGKVLRNFLNVDQFSNSVSLLKKMYSLQTSHEDGYQMAMIGAFYEFLQIICRAGESTPGNPVISHSQPHSIAEMAMAMARHCQNNWPVEKMCKVSRMSRPTLFREFKKYYNTTPVKFLTTQRLRKACALLRESDMNLEAVATACGFASGSYFATVFKEEFGLSPFQYRKSGTPQQPPLLQQIY